MSSSTSSPMPSSPAPAKPRWSISRPSRSSHPRRPRHAQAPGDRRGGPARDRHAALRAGVDAHHLEPSRRGLGQAARRHCRRHRPPRSTAPSRARAHVRPAQLAHPPPRRAGGLWSVMTSMTPRALARSATISEGVAIEVSPETRLALARADALQLTRLSVGPYGRFCPVHVWPVFRCPPRPPAQRWTESRHAPDTRYYVLVNGMPHRGAGGRGASAPRLTLRPRSWLYLLGAAAAPAE